MTLSDQATAKASLLIQGTAVIPVPGVQHGFVGVGGHHAGLVEGGHRVVCLPGAVLVQRHKVHCPPGCVVFFRDAHHLMTPCGGCATGDLLYHTDGLIPVEARLDLLLPMERNGDRAVTGHWLCTLLEVNLDRWPVHSRQGLALATVEC